MIPKNVREGAVAEGLDGEKVSFTIKANGKAFRTLIDGLYSNKVRAVIRELSSNGHDSHIAAGQTRPIEISVPTSLDPVFRVRDFGTSLTHDQVMRLYTSIFESTKEETNDQTGQLGLGSKSPFAYTDTFSVVAYLHGERRTYIAYLETDGVPCINYVGAEPTIEPQGFEVMFPAKRQDLTEFQREMHYVSLGYKPGTIKVEGMNIKPLSPRLHGTNWALYPNDQVSQNSYSGQNYVRMGSVVYPIPNRLSSVSGQYSVIVDIPIGTAEVTASRESLSMDDDTRRAINHSIANAEREIEAQVKDAIEKVAGDSRRKRAEANALYGDILPRLGGSTEVSLLKDTTRAYTTDPEPGEVVELTRWYTKSSSGRYQSGRTTNRLDVKVLDRVIIILDDTSQKLVRRGKRINEYYVTHTLAYIVHSADPKELAAAKAWIKKCWELRDDQFIDAQNIPDCPPPKRAASPKRAARKMAHGQLWMSRRDGKVMSDIYGWSDRGVYEWPSALLQAAQSIGFKLVWDNIFWVNGREEEKFLKDGTITASRKLDGVLEKKVKAHVLAQPLDQAQTFEMVSQVVGAYNHALPVVLAEFFPDVKITRGEAEALLKVARIANIDLQKTETYGKVTEKVKTLVDEYPLLFQKSGQSHYEHYVKAVKATKS